MMKNIKNFRGVFALDQLPGAINKNECGIVNYQNSDQPGSHWIAYHNNEVFDSYGLPPPEKLKKYIKTRYPEIVYNSTQYQKSNSVLCGYYCMDFIKKRNKGLSYYDILYKTFDQTPSEKKEDAIFYSS